jgi:hypothetical protein
MQHAYVSTISDQAKGTRSSPADEFFRLDTCRKKFDTESRNICSHRMTIHERGSWQIVTERTKDEAKRRPKKS